MKEEQEVLDPVIGFQALQQFASSEVSRLYGEIAYRDTLIYALREKLAKYEYSDKDVKDE